MLASLLVPVAPYDLGRAAVMVAQVRPWVDEVVVGVPLTRAWSGAPLERLDDAAVRAALGDVVLVRNDWTDAADPLAADTAERNELGHVARGRWLLSVDADEAVAGLEQLRAWLEAADPDRDGTAVMTVVWKALPDGSSLVVDPPQPHPVLTTARHAFRRARATCRAAVPAPLAVRNHSTARTPEELATKLAAWGHARDVDAGAWLARWAAATPDLTDVGAWTRDGAEWPRLRLVPA